MEESLYKFCVHVLFALYDVFVFFTGITDPGAFIVVLILVAPLSLVTLVLLAQHVKYNKHSSKEETWLRR